ncbi:MAG: hypothetical protein R6X02_05215 [Enhygromyxa sp.]
MEELDPALAQLYLAYLAELGEAIEHLRGWWQRLEATHGRKPLRLRWPAGVASHPRVLGIYRDYHRRIDEATRPPASGPAPRFDDDGAWGAQGETAPPSLLPIAPERLLIERLQVEAPELYAAMIPLVMSPVGASPEPRPSLRSLEVVEPDPRRVEVFSFEGRHGIARGLERLLAAPSDLRPEPLPALRLDEASEFHRLAHQAYLRDLEGALLEAERWWTEELGRREARGMSAEQAIDDAYAAHPVGPVSHPRVLGIIQAYWALCEEINATLGTTEAQVAPEQLLLGWLGHRQGQLAGREGPRRSEVDLLTAMPYWPIGLDAQGRWF